MIKNSPETKQSNTSHFGLWRGGGEVQDSSVFARRPCCIQTIIEIQSYTNLNRVIYQRAGNDAHRICTLLLMLYVLLSCDTYCCALCLFHGFVRKTRIVSTFNLCASRRRGDRPQRTFKSNKSRIDTSNRVHGISPRFLTVFCAIPD